MTRELFTPSPLYTISTTGPYPITHPYRQVSEITCTIFKGTTIVELVNGTDFTVSPSGSKTTGDVTLSAAIFAAYTGASLSLGRITPAEQGWAGQTTREKAIEDQLDAITQRLQEMEEAVGRAIKLPEDTAPKLPLDTSGQWLGWNASNVLTAGIPATTTLLTTAWSATLLDDATPAEARRTLEIGGTGPIVLVIDGQSNAEGPNSGGPNPASSRVKTWDGVTNTWGSSDYTQAPWTYPTPNGNNGNNNIGLARAHYLEETTGREVFIIYNATGGASIDGWVSNGTPSPHWVRLADKVALALATPELAGKTTVDEIIWAQGEADYLDTFAEHLANLKLLRNQFRGEAWCDWETPIYMIAPSNQHDRYAPSSAIAYMCSKVDNRCIFVPTNGLRTSYDPMGDGSVIVPGGDYTHWFGPDNWIIGYTLIAAARPFEAEPSLFYQPGNGSPDPSSRIVISTFDSITNYACRTGGEGQKETFSGDGVSATVTMLTRDPLISRVVVDGVDLVDGVDYTLLGQVITFTTILPLGTDNIDVYLAVTFQAPASFGSISWGLFCYAKGSRSYCFGNRVYTGNLSNDIMLVGSDLHSENTASRGFGTGWQNILGADNAVVGGQGNKVFDDAQAAFGTFCKYTTPQADPVRLQIGIGTTDASRKNGLAVLASGTVEMDSLLTFASNTAALTAGLAAGQIYQTTTGEIRIVV